MHFWVIKLIISAVSGRGFLILFESFWYFSKVYSWLQKHYEIFCNACAGMYVANQVPDKITKLTDNVSLSIRLSKFPSFSICKLELMLLECPYICVDVDAKLYPHRLMFDFQMLFFFLNFSALLWMFSIDIAC